MTPLHNTLTCLTVAAMLFIAPPARAAPDCKTVKGAGVDLSNVTVCATTQQQNRGFMLSVDGVALEMLSTDNPYVRDEIDVDLNTAQAFDAGIGDHVLLTTVTLSVRGRKPGKCRYQDSTVFWSLFKYNGVAWQPILSIEQESDYSTVGCHENEARGKFYNRTTLDLLPVSLDIPMLFATSQQRIQEPGERLHTTLDTVAWIFDAAQYKFTPFDMGHCPPGSTPAPVAAGAVNCLDGDGKKHGPQRTLHPGGQLASQSWYHHGQRAGAHASWYPDGGPLLMGLVDDQGATQKHRVAYHNNGQPREVEVYRDGQRVSGKYFDDEGHAMTFERMNADKKIQAPPP